MGANVLNDWPLGKRRVLFARHPQCSVREDFFFFLEANSLSRATRGICWKSGNITRTFPRFGWGIFNHVMYLDQSRAREIFDGSKQSSDLLPLCWYCERAAVKKSRKNNKNDRRKKIERPNISYYLLCWPCSTDYLLACPFTVWRHCSFSMSRILIPSNSPPAARMFSYERRRQCNSCNITND